jgi:hypothetical protein
VAQESITIPAGAAWTILCDPVTTPDHVQRAAELKSQLIQLTGKRDFYVIHKDTESDIYYGFYKSISRDANNPAEYERSHNDLQWIRTLVDSRTGDAIFRMPIMSPIDSPDPASPLDWNLANAPADAYWSLQIGAYTDAPTRKQAAVEAVSEARKAGIPAYYFHGDTVSSVCIGLWPIGAVKNQAEDSTHGDAGYTDDPNEALMVLGGSGAPNNISPDMVDQYGNKVKIMAMKLEIQDQSLKNMIAKYPKEVVNGEYHYHAKTPAGQPLWDQTFLVQVPHGTPANQVASPAPEAAPDQLPASPDAGVAPDPTAGALRSLGDK